MIEPTRIIAIRHGETAWNADSTLSACSEKREKFVPTPSQRGPSGNGLPGQSLTVRGLGQTRREGTRRRRSHAGTGD